MTLDELQDIAQTEREEQKKISCRVNVSVAAGCLSLHSDQVFEILKTEVHKRGLKAVARSRLSAAWDCARPVP